MFRRPGRLAAAGTLLLLLCLFSLNRFDGRQDHYIQPDGGQKGASGFNPDEVSPVSDWKAICTAHGFSAFTPPRKVYDLVLFSTELDWLEIRLHAHGPYVDYFVIIESPTTFSGASKPLHLQEHWARFKDFHHKIIYRTVEDSIKTTLAWDHEDFLRNAMLKEVFPGLEGSRVARRNDVLIVSDMDEMLKPSTLLLMRYCDIPQRLTLRTHFYYYSFQWLHRGEQWPHPQATLFGGSVENTIAPNDLRMNLIGSGFPVIASLSRWWNSATLWNAGWHCSSCFSTIEEMRTKMHSFSHTKWNTEANRNAATMVQRVREGQDLFGRSSEVYDRVSDNTDVPRYILDTEKHGERFKYLLDRDGEDAGFEDWEAMIAHSD